MGESHGIDNLPTLSLVASTTFDVNIAQGSNHAMRTSTPVANLGVFGDAKLMLGTRLLGTFVHDLVTLFSSKALLTVADGLMLMPGSNKRNDFSGNGDYGCFVHDDLVKTSTMRTVMLCTLVLLNFQHSQAKLA
jgi:hypothetical protein